MFSDKRYIVYVYVYQKQVVYAHIRKVKFPENDTSHFREAYNLYSGAQCDMSVCLSVIPVCATNQELNRTVLVSSLSVYANYQLSATFDQPIRSRILPVSQFFVHSQRNLRPTVYSIFSYSMMYPQPEQQLYSK